MVSHRHRLAIPGANVSGRRGYQALYLETGSPEFFAPARRLYARHGFTECTSFGDYTLDPNSVYMMVPLHDGAAS